MDRMRVDNKRPRNKGRLDAFLWCSGVAYLLNTLGYMLRLLRKGIRVVA